MSTSLQVGQSFGRLTRIGNVRAAVRDEIILAVAFVALIAVVIQASIVGAGSFARVLYIAAGISFAMVTMRRSPWLFVSATIWFWLFTGFVRRMIEWKAVFVPGDFVLVTPNLMMLFIIPGVLTTPGLLARRGIGYCLLLLGCGFYGLSINFFQGDIFTGAVGAADWIAPTLYLFHFASHSDRIDEAEVHLESVVTISLIFLLPYTINQYFQISEWDAKWMIAADMGSNGSPLPELTRVFGTLPAPTVLAIWCAVCIILLSHFRNKLLLVLAPFLLLVELMPMVRAAWGSLIISLLIGAAVGRGGFVRLIALFGIGFLLTLASVGAYSPHLMDQFITRFETFQHLNNDGSAIAREGIWKGAPDLLDRIPLGEGIGAHSHSRSFALQSGNYSAAQGDTADFDAGPVSIYVALGWVGGTLYLMSIALLAIHAIRTARRGKSAFAITIAVAGLCPLFPLPFNNLFGFAGAIAWLFLGYALALDMKRQVMDKVDVASNSMRLAREKFI